MNSATIHASAKDEQLGRTGMILFLAAELMLFVGLLGSFLVLRGSNGDLFAAMMGVPSHGAAVSEIVSLFAGTAALVLANRGGRWWIGVAIVCGFVYLGILSSEYLALLNHQTIVGRQAGQSAVELFDGSVIAQNAQAITLRGFMSPATDAVDIHQVGPGWPGAVSGDFTIAKNSISGQVNYFMTKNDYFADARTARDRRDGGAGARLDLAFEPRRRCKYGHLLAFSGGDRPASLSDVVHAIGCCRECH